jgi:LPXTG-site transpeptidase (sortase) family protein
VAASRGARVPRTLRRRAGLALYVSGGLLASFACGRYAVGMVRRDQARADWDEAQARYTVVRAEAAYDHGGPIESVAEGSPVARLIIPSIDLNEIVLEGVDGDDLNAAPGHLPGSAFPGEAGNSILSAHRDRHFNHLDQLDIGDTIRTESGMHNVMWRVISKRVLSKESPALFSATRPTLTLTTCWPIRYLGPAPDRLIITAEPVGVAAPVMARSREGSASTS